MIVSRLNGEVAGTMACRIRGHAADFGYFLRRTAWGQGFVFDAGQLLVNWLQSQPNLHRIWATTDVENQRSIRVLERLGLVREGVLRKATVRPNIGPEPRDTVMYAWVRSSS